MPDDRAPARREHGRFLLLVMAILIIIFLVIALWGSRRSTTTSPTAPVRSEEPAR